MMGNNRRKLSMVGLALVVTLLAAACSSNKNSGTTNQGGAGTAQKGGVYRTALSDFGFTGGFDPTGEYLGLAWDMFSTMARTLVSYKFVAGADGNKLNPDLATDLPTPTDNGLTYTFKLKPNLKFSPPVNRAITSKDIEYAFERINAKPLVAQYGFYYYGVIKGMDGNATAPAPISGIETPNDSTIVFHLTKPTGDFLYRLALPATAPVPQEVGKCATKAGDYGRYIISSGPYMFQGLDKLTVSSCAAIKPVAGFDPTKKMYLVRNPNWDAASDSLRHAYVDGIKIDVDSNVDDIFNKVQSGALDGSLGDQPPKTILRQYLTDQNKKKYLHVDSGDRTWYVFLNTTTPPFDDLHVRKAANYVMDKAAIAQAWGGSTSGQVATHIMPPTVLSDQLGADFDPYGSPDHTGDVAKAMAEMKQSKYDTNKDGKCDAPACRGLVMVNRNVAPWTDTEPVVVTSLAKIGIQVKPRELARGAAYQTTQTIKNQIPVGLNAGWGKDYPDAFSFAGSIFSSADLVATGNPNYAMIGTTPAQVKDFGIKVPPGWVAPTVDSDIDNCQKIPATDPTRVTCWAALDKKLMNEIVPWVPYLWANVTTLTAPSVTHYEFDQFSAVPALVNIAVNNKEKLGS